MEMESRELWDAGSRANEDDDDGEQQADDDRSTQCRRPSQMRVSTWWECDKQPAVESGDRFRLALEIARLSVFLFFPWFAFGHLFCCGSRTIPTAGRWPTKCRIAARTVHNSATHTLQHTATLAAPQLDHSRSQSLSATPIVSRHGRAVVLQMARQAIPKDGAECSGEKCR